MVRALAYQLLNPLLRLDELRAELGSMLDGPTALAAINAEIAEQLAAEQFAAGMLNAPMMTGDFMCWGDPQ